MTIDFEFVKELFKNTIKHSNIVEGSDHGDYIKIESSDGEWGIVAIEWTTMTYLLFLDGEVMANIFVNDSKLTMLCLRVPSKKFSCVVDLNLKSFNSKIKSQLRTIVKHRYYQAGS